MKPEHQERWINEIKVTLLDSNGRDDKLYQIVYSIYSEGEVAGYNRSVNEVRMAFSRKLSEIITNTISKELLKVV